MQRGLLKKEDEDIIQTNYVYLKEQLEARDLTDALFASKVISTTDKERIDNGIDRSVRNEELLKTLLHAGSGPAFEIFLKSLEKQYGRVLKYFKRSAQKAVKIGNLKKQIEELNKLVEKLNKQFEDVKADRDETREQLINKCEENIELQACLAQNNVTIEKLKYQLQDVEAHLDETRDKLMKKCKENIELQTRLAQSDVTIEKLKYQLDNVKANLDETREELMKKCEKNKKLQTRLDAAETKLRSQSKIFSSNLKYEANRNHPGLLRSTYTMAFVETWTHDGKLLKREEMRYGWLKHLEDALWLMARGGWQKFFKSVQSLMDEIRLIESKPEENSKHR